MSRRPTSLRLSELEKRILRNAASECGRPWTTFLREAALERAVDVLADDDTGPEAAEIEEEVWDG